MFAFQLRGGGPELGALRKTEVRNGHETKPAGNPGGKGRQAHWVSRESSGSTQDAKVLEWRNDGLFQLLGGDRGGRARLTLCSRWKGFRLLDFASLKDED